MQNQINLKRPAAQFSMVIGLGLLLSACGGVELPGIDPNPTPTEQAGLIKGQIDVTKISTTKVRQKELSLSAPVTADGRFDLGLPLSTVMTSTNNTLLFGGAPNTKAQDVFGLCDNIVSDAPSTLKLYAINFLSTDQDENIISPFDTASGTYNFRAWWYSNEDVTFSFKGDNCVPLGNINTTLTLKRGWNVLNTDIVFGSKTTYAVTAQPDTYTPWVKATQSMSSQALAANILEPWKNLPQYRNR